jgi:ComF family protein
LTLDVPTSDTSRWRAVVRVLRSPVDALSCAIFPSSCCVCGNPLLRLSLAPVCDSCWNNLPIQEGMLCCVCGENIGIATFPGGYLESQEDSCCRVCRMSPPPFRKAVAHGVYEGTLRSLIHALKYERTTAVADALGMRLADAISMLAAEAPQRMLVVPVPLHRSKRHSRGYNQSELLARAALKSLRRTHREWKLEMGSGTLMRGRATESQSGLSTHQRRENLRGVFSVPNADRLAGRDVLLVDDIYTTGATARACSKALLKAGAKSVWVATLARAQREGVALWDANFGKTAGTVDRAEEPVSSFGSGVH